MSTLSRRTFLASSFAAFGAAAISRPARAITTAYDWHSSPRDYLDEVSDALVHVLTPRDSTDEVIYQTDPMWLMDMEYLIYYSDRSGVRLPYAQEMGSGIARPMATEPIGPLAVRRDKRELIFAVGRTVVEQPLVQTFQGTQRPRLVKELPPHLSEFSGGFSFDADGETMYAGILEEEGKWAVWSLHIHNTEWKRVVSVDFRVGHVQAHPTIPGLILFCKETGGDADQRTWVVRPGADIAVPFYKEWYGEWVTHEVWWADGRALFTIWPYDEEHLNARHGVVSVDLTGHDFRDHAIYPAWHTHGSPDGKWILGDDFDRNIWLINGGTHERRLLTQGHNGEGQKTHPHASFTPDSKAIVFNSTKFGRQDVMVVELREWEKLPPAPAL